MNNVLPNNNLATADFALHEQIPHAFIVCCSNVDTWLLQDAFPPNFVRENRFQRQATLLVYLNSVLNGGATHFERLDVSIQPEVGKALLFFPAFSDGTPDPR